MQTNNCTFHVESGCRASNAKKVPTISGGRKCSGEHCSLCKGHLRRSHSHPEQWNGELQQFLLQYTDIPDPLHACVCKADELSIRKDLSGKCKGEFTPRWLKREKNKMKPCCVVVSQATPFAEGGRVWSCCNYRVVAEEHNYRPLRLGIIRCLHPLNT